MPRKKIVEEETQEEQIQNETPLTTSPQEQAVDEIFNEQVEEITSQNEQKPQEPQEKTLDEQEQKEEQKEEKETDYAKEESQKKEEEKTKEEDGLKEEEKKEIKQEETTKTLDEERKILEEAGLSKFKSLKDALEAYKELESAFGKAQTTIQAYQRGVIPQEIKEGVEGAINLVSRPRVKFELPNPESYQLEDGTFDVKTYVEDALNNYTLSLQKSLVFGELASAFYTVLSRAVVDKYQNLSQGMKIEEEANNLAKQIETLFPQIKTDERRARIFEKAIRGAREEKGDALTADEILTIAKDVFGTQPVKKEEPIETGGSTGQLTSSESPITKPKTKEEQAIDEIFESSINKSNTSLF